MSALPIVGNGSGSWLPTPSATSYGSNQGGAAGRVGKVRESLESMARHATWPTPDANDWKQDGLEASKRRLEKWSTISLNAAVRLWPTPNVPNGGRTLWHAEQKGNSFYHKGKKVQLELEQAVRMWATPTAHGNTNYKGCSPTSGDGLQTQVGGPLNPRWVEWLMGWPIGWTSLEVWGMDGSPNALWPHGISSTKEDI